MRWRSQSTQIPGQYKIVFLAACLLACLLTVFIPYNSFHLNTSSNLSDLFVPVPMKRYCVAIIKKHNKKCGDVDDEECSDLREDASDCQYAVVKAYHEINFSGCLKYSAKHRVCSLEWCSGDETSGDIVGTKNKVDDASDSSSRDQANKCNKRCKAKADDVKNCEERILKKWFRKYGVKDEYH